jgi:hypothetical protein
LASLSCNDISGRGVGYGSDFTAYGIPIGAGFNQAGLGDESPPNVTAFAVETTTVNTTRSPAYIVVSLGFTDDLSGMQR